MKIIAKKVKCKHLMPGELFSNADQSLWDSFLQNEAVGLMVYIRTHTPCPAENKEDDIYRIRIEKAKENG